MGKKAEGILADLKRLRENYDYYRFMSEESARIESEAGREKTSLWYLGERTGWYEALLRLDDVIEDWDDSE